MTKSIQKQDEIFYAESLSKDIGQNWIIKSSPDEQNWPDLIVMADDETFGLEVRYYFKDENSTGSPLKKRESQRQKLLKELSSRYYEKRHNPIHLKISGQFSSQSIDQIFDTLLKVNGKEWEVIEKEIIIENDRAQLVIRFLPDSFQNYKKWIYRDDNIGWVRRISDVEIENLAKLKSKKLDKYKQNVKKVSLLIVANRIKSSGRVQVENTMKINTYGFNKVYFYIYPLDAVIYECH